MSHKQYFKAIDPLVQYPPATYCPANDYVFDPTIYVPNVDLIPSTPPATDKIILICTYGDTNKVAFTAYAVGGYTVNIFGAADALIYTQNLGSNVTFSYTFIDSEAYLSNGLQSYRIEITSQTANPLTGFFVKTISGVSVGNWLIKRALFYTPSMGTMYNAFLNIIDLEEVIFYANMNVCPSMRTVVSGCSSLQSFIFPSEINLCNDIRSAFASCTSLKKITLPATLPAVTTISAIFTGCTSLVEVTYPASLPLCTDGTSIHFGNSSLLTVTLPDMPLVSGLTSAFANNTMLQEVIFPANLPEWSGASSMFSYCSKLSTVTFPLCPKLSAMTSMFQYCSRLKTVVLADSMPAVTNMQQAFISCIRLETITMPTLPLTALTTIESAFASCYLLREVLFPEMPNLTNMMSTFGTNQSLTNVRFEADGLGANTTKIANLSSTFSGCSIIENIYLPQSGQFVTAVGSLFTNCNNLKIVRLPYLSIMANLDYLIYNLLKLVKVLASPLNNGLPALTSFQSFATSTLIDTFEQFTFGTNQINATGVTNGKTLAAFNQPTLRVSKFSISAPTPAASNAMTSVEIDWVNSTYGGTSPQIFLQYLNLDATEINRIFTALPTVVGKTIDMRNCPGYATCDKTIATGKGWTAL